MRNCCIKHCASREKDSERRFFEINDKRKEWIIIVKNHQTIPQNQRLFICDLHFNVNDIQHHPKKTILRKNAVPTINLQQSGNNNDNGAVCDDDLNKTSHNNDLALDQLEDQEKVETEPNLKTITIEEYKNLMQLMLQVKKNEETIKKMEEIIKLKDAQLKNLRSTLEEGQSIQVCHLSNEQREVIYCLINGISKNGKYSENVRKFCMRQQYYSFAAYQSLRLFFNKNLPSKRTFQLWYNSIDASPGICDSAIEIIREKAASYLAENHHPLHLCVMSDEMSVRKEICWSAEKQSFIGFSTMTNLSQQNDDQSQPRQLKVAKDVLVYMAVGPDFKVPLAYHFVNGLEAVDRAIFTLEVIKRIEKALAIVISITGDGLAANVTAAEILGTKFNEEKPYFYSPTHQKQKIYIIFDPPHMLKLVRKHFSSQNMYHCDEIINWDLLRILVDKQSSDNFSLCNKLTKNHINWCQNPQNVKLAAQTISRSAADALEILSQDGYEEFANCKTTATFLRMFNDGYDILNVSEKRHEDHGFKQALRISTADFIFSFSEKLKEYIKQLEIRLETKRKPILQSSQERGFFGFYYNFVSLQGIFDDFILNGPLEVFYTFQFSQDHLETFFSLIRNSLGRNDNPNAVEFRSAFRKLLVCHPIITSVGSNTITNATGILTVSSKNRKKLPPKTSTCTVNIEIEISYEELMLNELENMNSYDQHMAAYISLCIEQKMLQNIKRNRYKCSDCANEVLLAPVEKINDALLSMKPEAKQPSASTLKIVLFSNAVMKIVSQHRDQGNNFDMIMKFIFNNIDVDDLYQLVKFDQHEYQTSKVYCHKEEFIMEIIKTYMTLKSEKIGKKITDEERGEPIRHKKKDAVHHAGQ